MPKKIETSEEAIEALLKRKALRDLTPTEKQLEQILDLQRRSNVFMAKRRQDKENAILMIADFIRNGVDTFYYRRWRKLVAYGLNTANRRRNIYRYGANGIERHDAYKNRQAETNSLEYKKKTHGMTEEEFKEYNKSRSVTLENMIARHGIEEGTERFESYCQRQGFTNTLEYFIERDGIEAGTAAYEEVCRQKGHTYEVYLERYGDHDTAVENLLRLSPHGKNSPFANNFISELVAELNIKEEDYLSDKNGNEKLLFINTEKRVGAVDFYHKPTGKVIEIYGDYFHGNPRFYSPDDKVKMRHVRIGEKWADDMKRANGVIAEGHPVLILWEYDIKNDYDNVINRVKEFLCN